MTAATPKRRLQRNAEHQIYKLKDGSIVGGCSSIAKLGDNPEALIQWANREGLAGRSSRAIRDKAADVGSIGHFILDCHLRGYEPDLREFTSEEIDKGENVAIKGMDFLQVEKLTEVIGIELQLVSEKYRYGGTIDLVCKDEDSRMVLVDWKSSKAVYDSHRYQASGGYRLLWNENNPSQPIERCAIVLAGRDEETPFKAVWIPQEDAERHMTVFKAQANLFNAIKNK